MRVGEILMRWHHQPTYRVFADANEALRKQIAIWYQKLTHLLCANREASPAEKRGVL